jgi:hypothetical protein
VGTVAVNPADDRLLIFNIDPDTAPQNTLDPVDSVVNPLTAAPGDGLPAAALGQRYLLTESTGNVANVGTNPTAWSGAGGQPLIAAAGDIVEYNGVRWTVEFNSQTVGAQYVVNLTTGIQYYWDNEKWVKSIDGLYAGGAWNLIL